MISALNPPVKLFPEPSVFLCESFGKFFTNKVMAIRSQMSHTGYTLLDVPLYSSTWSVFEPLNLHSCEEIVDHLKLTSCPQDIVSPFFLKQIMDAVGPSLLSVINKCLQTGTVPVCLKQATVTPYLKKKQTLILHLFQIFSPSQIFLLFQRLWRKLYWLNYSLSCQITLLMKSFNQVLKLYIALNRLC